MVYSLSHELFGRHLFQQENTVAVHELPASRQGPDIDSSAQCERRSIAIPDRGPTGRRVVAFVSSAPGDGARGLLPQRREMTTADRTIVARVSDPAEGDDARLVRACLDGDDAAWAEIIQRYRRLIYSIPLRYGARPEDAADIFQAVCLEMFSELPRLRRVDSLRAWLITVTAHQSFHWKRRQAQRTAREGNVVDEHWEPVAPVVPDVLEAADREQGLRDGIARLPSRCRELIRLLFFEPTPLPYKDVGRRLGLATGSIGFIRGRCLKKLETELTSSGFSA